MKSAAQMVVNNLPKLKASLKKMVENAVFVGVPSETANVRNELQDTSPINNATLAYIHQNGSPAQNIPARPFMTIGIDNAKEPALAQLKKAAGDQLEKTDSANVTRGLKLAGQIAENAIKAAINSSIAPQLADSTLRARARRGRKGAIAELKSRQEGNEPSTENARTLVDTGAMRNSIKYVIRKN